MSIDPKFVELTADVLKIFFRNKSGVLVACILSFFPRVLLYQWYVILRFRVGMLALHGHFVHPNT